MSKILNLEYKSLTKFNVIAPVGAFGNHLRWLLFLDPAFSLTIAPTERDYNILTGPDWPTYQNYCQSNYANISPEITQQIQRLKQQYYFLNITQLNTIDEKINFIVDNIYCEYRTWSNWLNFEWRYRDVMDALIPFLHDPIWDPDIAGRDKSVGLIISPELALQAYLKFNSSLNNITIPYFLKMTAETNFNLAKQPNTLVCQADQLFSETLDLELYSQITNWLGLDNFYNEARYIHKLWFNLHKKAEQEFVKYVNEIYQKSLN